MILILLDYYYYLQSYLSLKSKNVVKFFVHISLFSHARSHIIMPSYTDQSFYLKEIAPAVPEFYI